MSAAPDAGRSARHSALSSPSRQRLLSLLASSPTGLDAQAIASASGLHVSTVRFHLTALERAHLVTSRIDQRHTRGRPHLLYSAAEIGGEQSTLEAYDKLTTVLVGRWTTAPDDDPQRRAELAGDDWAANELSDRAATPPQAFADGTRAMSTVLADLGFEPHTTVQGNSAELSLHRCPYAGLAATEPDVVCAVHLGLLKGLAARLGQADSDIGVGPWAQPGHCAARVTRRE